MAVGSSPTTRANKNEKMARLKIKEYVKESYDELMHKVSWPTYKELQGSALVVFVASLIIALVVFLMDISFENILKQFYKLF